jgi:hypothetical protein
MQGGFEIVAIDIAVGGVLDRFGTAWISELISINDCTAAVLASPSRGKISSAVYSSHARSA